ncbi:FtsK/SpoIIIE domain-containing protein [Nocardioides donggukensis]|uniref:FHA domain-containing protein n=1 Tax=Nocardioides donggukensis TaxID=2774019 RepID=A0A927K4F6_9ACTN|nr:FtsK/SpoIIIE domain-containing protein [Nocardioides donggukensis]MBD8870507.1 FHA domain-containing protein [Nocardioides donggukensis]
MRITVTLEGPLGASDILVECDDALSGRELVSALQTHGGGGDDLVIPPKLGVAHVSSHDGPVGDLGLRDGMRVGIGDAGTASPPVPCTGLQLHVVGGPDAGRVFALPVGTHEIGRSGVISWSDHSLSRRHLRVEVTADEVSITDLGSSNGSRMEGRELTADEPETWAVGDLVAAGDSLLLLRSADVPGATVEPAEPGWLNFLRPPRIQALHVTPHVVVPEAPEKRKGRRLPVIAMVAPLIFGTVMAIVWNPFFLMFALMSPIMMGANFLSQRRGDAKEHRDAVAQYDQDLEAAQQALDQALRSESHRLRDELPDPAATLVTALLPGQRLWERRRHDDDAYALRFGTSDVPSTVQVTGADDGSDHRLHAIPVGVSLTQSKVVGIAGPDAQVDDSLRWVISQLATYHAPRDLSLSFVTSRGGAEWGWLRWLPHLRPETTDACLAMVGNDPDTVAAQVAVLTAMIKARQEAARGSNRIVAESFPAHVVLVHGYRELRGTIGLAQVLEEGPLVGVYAVCTSDDERSLPERATATLVVDAGQPSYGALRRSGAARLPSVLLDAVSAPWCEQLARELSPLRDVGATTQGESLPDSARLLDVVGLEPPSEDAVRGRWRAQPRSTTMTLGIGLQGPFSLDLAGDGPHGLIAGMTGSGKTELLQTMIASLAVANRPDHLNLVLIDYKGNAAFKDCVHLPHTVGNVTNLDKHLVERALASLNAELKWRQRFLDEAKVKDIEDYQLLQSKETGRAPLPRLLLVIDEFAQLVKDLPEFVTGLVSIAQLGRSLGIHLILATQRPSGSVSPEIRANTNMRIALRVADTADSADVLESPDAARIPKSAPGRGYARLGAGALVAFQAGRVGGRRPGVVATDVAPPFLAPVGWHSLGYRPPQPVTRAQEEVSDTDLAALVEAVAGAADAEQVGEQRSPWLDALPERLLWEEIVAGKAVRGVVPPLPYGLRDLPDDQRQETASLDLDGEGHLLVFGSAKSGRSQVLRTLAGSIARLTDPADVHLYALDCGNGALHPLAALPHCGAVVNRTEGERAHRLLNRITSEMDRRQGLLAGAGYADIREQRRDASEPLPHLVLMLDRWEGFVPTLGESDDVLNAILRILREGASVGVHAVLTGDRTMANNSRVVSMSENKLTLRFADRSDYGLVGLSPRQMPDRVPAGRGFATGPRETQVALLAADDSGQAQAAVLQTLAEESRASASTDVRPFRVDVLPARATLELALGLAAAPQEPLVPVGVGGDELTLFVADQRNPAFVVAGPNRSGRSSILVAAARGFLRTGGQVLAVAPRSSPLQDLAGEKGVLGVVTDVAAPPDQYDALLAAARGPVLLVVDDGEALRESGGNDFFQRAARGQLESVFLLLGGHRDGLCSGFSGWQVDARKSRQGLLLSPQELGDGDLIGTRLTRQLIGRPTQAGTGWLHQGDGALRQVATLL